MGLGETQCARNLNAVDLHAPPNFGRNSDNPKHVSATFCSIWHRHRLAVISVSNLCPLPRPAPPRPPNATPYTAFHLITGLPAARILYPNDTLLLHQFIAKSKSSRITCEGRREVTGSYANHFSNDHLCDDSVSLF